MTILIKKKNYFKTNLLLKKTLKLLATLIIEVQLSKNKTLILNQIWIQIFWDYLLDPNNHNNNEYIYCFKFFFN